MSRSFTEDQMADPAAYGCMARWMTYLVIATFLVVGVIIGLLGIGWIFTGPISASAYDQAPLCSGSPDNSCRYIGSGTITTARQQSSDTEFGVEVAGRDYPSFYTNNARPTLTPGEKVTVEIWRGDVVAITPPDDGRLTTTLEPHVQAQNFTLPVVALVMVPFSGWLVWRQASTVRRARRRLRAARANPPSLPTELTTFLSSLSRSATPAASGQEFTVAPVPSMARATVRSSTVVIGLVVLLLPLIVVAATGGHPPSTGRAAGAYWVSIVMLPFLVTVTGGALLYRRLFTANVRLASSAGSLNLTRWTRGTRTFPRGAVAGIAVLTLAKPSQIRPFRRIYFLDRNGGVLEQMNGDLFRIVDIEHLAGSIGARAFKNEDEAYNERLVNQLFHRSSRTSR